MAHRTIQVVLDKTAIFQPKRRFWKIALFDENGEPAGSDGEGTIMRFLGTYDLANGYEEGAVVKTETGLWIAQGGDIGAGVEPGVTPETAWSPTGSAGSWIDPHKFIEPETFTDQMTMDDPVSVTAMGTMRIRVYAFNVVAGGRIIAGHHVMSEEDPRVTNSPVPDPVLMLYSPRLETTLEGQTTRIDEDDDSGPALFPMIDHTFSSTGWHHLIVGDGGGLSSGEEWEYDFGFEIPEGSTAQIAAAPAEAPGVWVEL